MRKPSLEVFLLYALIALAVPHQTGRGQSTSSKQGGICFRVDDDQPLGELRDFAAIFSKYGYRFTLAVNMSPLMTNQEYVNQIKEFQWYGHEIMDHTPDHAIHYFTVNDAAPYSTIPGVDHINGSKVCLRYGAVDTARFPAANGFASLSDNIVISKNHGAFSQIASDPGSYTGIYLPTLYQLCNVNIIGAANSTGVDTLQLLSFWGESIHLGVFPNLPYYVIRHEDVSMSPEALILLGQRSLNLFANAGLKPPTTWIQPGGNWPLPVPMAIKSTYGDVLNYTAGGAAQDNSLKCHNEYDPRGDRRYGLGWGDFWDDQKDFRWNKSVIAHKIARHYFLVGHSHFNNLLGGWDGYLARVDSLLAWCKANESRINVVTYQQMANLLYDTPQNAYVNIMPTLNVDLDENGVPDGYYNAPGYTDGHLDTMGGVAESGGYSYSISKRGSICYVNELAGLEKGENDFSIWTKGGKGDSIVVTFSFTRYPQQLFKFPAMDTVWRRYRLAQSTSGITKLVVPSDVSTMNVRISCSDYVSGTAEVSGMRMCKKAPGDLFPPWGLAAKLNGNRSVVLGWVDNSDNERGFIIEKAGGAAGNFVAVDTVPANSTTYLDSTFRDSSGLYRYRVRAFNDSTLSSNTNEVNTDMIADEPNSRVTAQQFALLQNYPNPFNPSTTINYSVMSPSKVRLDVYSLLGQRVNTLVDEEYKPNGVYSVSWDGRDDRNIKVASGIYFYRLVASPTVGRAPYVATSKMILLK